jgi:hypothetical protein
MTRAFKLLGYVLIAAYVVADLVFEAVALPLSAWIGRLQILRPVNAWIAGLRLRVQSISATALAVYRPAFRSPRSFADVD